MTTLRSVFPHCRLRIVGRGYYLLTASQNPTDFRDYKSLNADPILSEELKKSSPDFSPANLTKDLELSSDIFQQDLPFRTLLNTDDHPVLEFVSVSHRRAGLQGWNPFVEYQTSLAIDPVGRDLSSEEQSRREAIHKKFRTRFVRNFSPDYRVAP